MLIDGILEEKIWKIKGIEKSHCMILETTLSPISKTPTVLIKPLENEDIFEEFYETFGNGAIPMTIESFLLDFEPKLQNQ